MTNCDWMETQNLVISFDYSWFLAKNLAYDECWIMKFHYRNSSSKYPQTDRPYLASPLLVWRGGEKPKMVQSCTVNPGCTVYIYQDSKLLAFLRDLSRDDWIKEFIKRKWSSGLFWAVGAAEKKKLPTAISMQLFEVGFSTFCEQKTFLIFFLKDILASALKSYII